MKVNQPLQYFLAPALNNFKAGILDPLNILSEASTSDHLSDKRHLLLVLIIPCSYKVYYVFMF